MVIIVRNDLEMGKGKIAAQVAHAAVSLVLDSLNDGRTWREWLERWLEVGQPKVVVKTNSLDDLLARIEKARIEGLPTHVIQDAGKTQIEPGTITCGGIGPAPS
jgi:peptidyl-tRNA hydrolase